MEVNFRQNNVKKFYRGVNNVKPGYRPRPGTILKKTNNSLITDEAEHN